MITHLLDSDRLIDYLDDRRDARSLLAPLIMARQIATSIIVWERFTKTCSAMPNAR